MPEPRQIRILLELDLDGEIHGFVHAPGGLPGPFTVLDDEGNIREFGPGMIVTSLPGRSSTVFGGGGSGGSASIVLQRSALDLWAIRQQTPLQRASGRLLWLEEGQTLGEAREIHRGALRGNTSVLSGSGGSFSFSLAPPEREADIDFPPAGIADVANNIARFPTAPTRGLSQVVPVVYGEVLGLPLFPVTAEIAAPGLIRMIIAGHPIVDAGAGLTLRFSDGTALAGNPHPVVQATDGLGGTYSYVNVTGTGAGDYGTNANIHAETVTGWAGAGGAQIDRLGDVLIHAWLTYGRERFDAIDRERAYYAKPKLNRYRVGSQFNQGVQGGTLLQALSSRYGSQFPVSFGYTGGRLGWDATTIPTDKEAANPVRVIIYGRNAFQRSEITETSADQIRHDFRLAYGIGGLERGNLSQVNADHTNSGGARRALSRYGQGPKTRLSASDVPDAGTAHLLLTDQVRRLSRVRTRVAYMGLDPDWLFLPLLSIVHVTDRDTGWSAEPFMIESLQPRLDGRVDVGLISHEPDGMDEEAADGS